VQRAGATAFTVFLIGSALYFVQMRYVVWNISYGFWRHFISLGKTSKPSGLHGFFWLAGRFLSQGTCLLLLWQFSNAAIHILMAQEPLKNGNPITSESKDPNGSLLNGLKSAKEDNKVCETNY
jgi:nucleoporin NDC1